MKSSGVVLQDVGSITNRPSGPLAVQQLIALPALPSEDAIALSVPPTTLAEPRHHDCLQKNERFLLPWLGSKLRCSVEQAADSEKRIDRVEREVVAQIRELGRTLMRAFVDRQGSGSDRQARSRGDAALEGCLPQRLVG